MKFVNKKADPVKKPPILSYTTKAPPRTTKTSTEKAESPAGEKEPSEEDEVETKAEEEKKEAKQTTLHI